MDRKTRFLLVVLAGLILAICLVGAYAVWRTMQTPLGPPLAVSTTREAPESTVVISADTVCGQSEPMLVLVLLTQREHLEPSRQALALRLVKVDFVNRTVASVYFPKELRVTIDSLGDVGFRDIRLDEVYRLGMELQNDDLLLATSLVAQALSDTFGVQPDHYFTLDLTRLAEMIDAVGGVDVQILSEYDATAIGLPHFQVGEMHMPGELALAYAAAASADARWDGLERQTRVLKALGDKALSPTILPQIPELIETFRVAVTTDLSIQQGLDLACLAGQVSSEQVTFNGVDSDLVRTEPDGSLAPHVEEIISLLIETFGEL